MAAPASWRGSAPTSAAHSPAGKKSEQVRLEMTERQLEKTEGPRVGGGWQGRGSEHLFFPLGNSALHVGLGVMSGEILITAKALRYQKGLSVSLTIRR